MKRTVGLVVVLAAASCSSRSEIALNYELGGIAPADVVRVETVVAVDPSDPREFFADQPYREVATGVGYEVRDVDGSGRRSVLITHDATLGYVFTKNWTFTLLPPTGEAAPKLMVVASAHSPDDTIGQTMPLGAAFGNGAAVIVNIPDERCGGARCRDNQSCCSMMCIDPLADSLDCGMCGAACNAGEQCLGGTCSCAGGSTCGAGLACCASGCVDKQHNHNNCGACGNKCAAGEICAGGNCHCGTGAACGAGMHCCNGTCQATSCLCNGAACDQLCCNNNCIPEDDQHCGDCTTDCTTMGTGLTCSSGMCACQGVVCQGSDKCCSTGCANTTNNNLNCGACDHACGTGEQCVNSKCLCGGTAACASNQVCCGGTCVDTTSDHANCGSCGHVCRAGEVCTMSTCSCAGGRPCVGNETCCAGPAGGGGSGGCFDLSSDQGHCGSCTIACLQGQSCIMGGCQASSCPNGCTNNNTCVNGACLCGSAPGCSGTQTCCANIGCVDEQSDPQHCGSCNKACPVGNYCCGGTCTPPDNNNCTACNVPCKGLTPICCYCPPGGGGTTANAMGGGTNPAICTTLGCACTTGL